MKPSSHSQSSQSLLQRQLQAHHAKLERPTLWRGQQQPRSVDELVVAGNQEFETLENVDFAGFRNDKEMSRAVLAEIREQVAPFHPEGRGKAYNDDVRRVVNARYVQGHGVQVQAHLDGDELATLRRYVQQQDTTPNVADAVRGLNDGLSQGQRNVGLLVHGAERALFAERGISGTAFDASFSRLDVEELRRTRDFADHWANSESGRFLLAAHGDSFAEKRRAMIFEMLSQRGYRGTERLEESTALSLVRDTESEGPGTNATIAAAINQALAQGTTDYFALSTSGNEAILKELGLSADALAGMAVSDSALRKAYGGEPAEQRAIRTRVLRDLLRVLPEGERAAALIELEDKRADLVEAEKVLSKYLGRRIRTLGNDSVPYTRMGAMQRANLTSALSRLPEGLRESVFTGDPSRSANKLEQAIERQFGINLHREVGKAPDGNQAYDPYVQDIPLQTMADLYNALTSMSKHGGLPPGVGQTTTISYMVGSPPSPSMTPVTLSQGQDEKEPFDRPGSSAHQRGQSGFFGECGQDQNGHDGIVLYDDQTLGANGDGPVGLTQGEGTIIHELSHAIQLGGVPGTSQAERARSDRKNIAEWSSLSLWTEPDRRLADGAQGDYLYYYDPGVQVTHRQEVATSYGASDPSEDFAEFSPFFFKDPTTAMKLSPEKFLYFNRFMGEFYDTDGVARIGAQVGLDAQALANARQSMRIKVAAAPAMAGL